MTALELLETYPKAANMISQFYQQRLIQSMNTDNVPEDFKELLKQQNFDNLYVSKFLDANPRILFDVFDENGIFVETLYMENKFHFTIVNEGEGVLAEPESFDTRMECDRSAIRSAMKLLNDKL
jgi:hypothetical protein